MIHHHATLRVLNGQVWQAEQIPQHSYEVFYEIIKNFFQQKKVRIVDYIALQQSDSYLMIAILAEDNTGCLHLLAHRLGASHFLALNSLTPEAPAFHVFERLLYEKYGIDFLGHPWLKPVRFYANANVALEAYPFYKFESAELHQVGVGPIHAGVIEPGHFRFNCYGEQVLHLDIQLGYQHRGIEALFLQKKHYLQQTILAEQIAGDTTVAHTLAYVTCIEAMLGINVGERLLELRALALELERIALHVGSLSALCADIGYQLGSSVLGALRTPLINFFQTWCGSRFGKGLIRIGYNPYPYERTLHERLAAILSDFDFRYCEMADQLFSNPEVLNRFEKTAVLTFNQAKTLGIVGTAARASGLSVDSRQSHPYGTYKYLPYETKVLHEGDVWARAKIRDMEIRQSLLYIRTLMTQFFQVKTENIRYDASIYEQKLPPKSGCTVLVEGWRGEIAHTLVTDSVGSLSIYSVVDPSVHNWFGLSMAMRQNEIADFPICNKSFDLSYCGHDL